MRDVMKMDKRELAFSLLPQAWREQADLRADQEVEEIRLRVGRNPTVLNRGAEKPFLRRCVEENDLFRILEKATDASMHAAEASFSQGYVNYRGLRIGVCGAAQMVNGQIKAFRRISSLAIRIPREYRGICALEIHEMLDRGMQNTLVLGPPGAGKTTALREIIRCLSESGYRVGVVDERNELAALDREGPAFDLGKCSDVLTGLSKADAMMMLLRGMNPQIIAMDEISRLEDLEALEQITGSGVWILASAHGGSLVELRFRRAFREALDRQLFPSVLHVSMQGGERHYRMERLQL